MSVGEIDPPTFIKWAGGKRQLLSKYVEEFPDNIQTYYEPFLGGGAVLFFVMKHLKPERAFAYDINLELMNAYKQVKNNVEKLIDELQALQEEHNDNEDPKSYYYEQRDTYNELKNKDSQELRRAALFIYVNKTCFNGLYRENSDGEFNVPFNHSDKANIFSRNDLREASYLLSNVELDSKDFRNVSYEEQATVYFDPPYWGGEDNNGFTQYTKNEFGREEQKELANLASRLKDQGATVLISNSNTQLITESLYNSFDIATLTAKRAINCNGEDRSDKKEVLIS